MKFTIIILTIILYSVQAQAQAEITPFQKGKVQEIELVQAQKKIQLPVSITSPKGDYGSTLLVPSFKKVQYFTTKNPANSTAFSKQAHQYYQGQLKKLRYHKIFGCKDGCRNILSLLMSNLLPSNAKEMTLFATAKRYSYTVFHQAGNIVICVTLYNRSNETNTLIGFTSF